MTPPPADAVRDAIDLAAPSDPMLVRLFDYWGAKRGNRQMPRRADVDPVELRGLLPYVVLCDVVDPARFFRVRVIGQAVVDFIGVNITGRSVTDMMPPAAAKRMIEIASGVVARRSPRFRTGQAYWHRDKSYRKFEACFLPLSPDDRTVTQILGGVTFATDC